VASARPIPATKSSTLGPIAAWITVDRSSASSSPSRPRICQRVPERDVAAWMSVEADDRYDHLAPHGPSDHISPRVCDNPLDRDARADLLGQDPGDRVLERLGPAVQHQELDPIGADAGYDLAAFEVVGYAHGPDADTSSAGFPHATGGIGP